MVPFTQKKLKSEQWQPVAGTLVDWSPVHGGFSSDCSSVSPCTGAGTSRAVFACGEPAGDCTAANVSDGKAAEAGASPSPPRPAAGWPVTGWASTEIGHGSRPRAGGSDHGASPYPPLSERTRTTVARCRPVLGPLLGRLHCARRILSNNGRLVRKNPKIS